MTGQIIGYVRVSSAEQNDARQVEDLGEVDRIFTDRMSGKNRERPELIALQQHVREGDTIRVKSPDRLARSTIDLMQIVSELNTRGVSVEFVDNPALNTNTPQGEFMLTILAAVAQLERAVIRERQAEGIALAKQRGTYQRAPKLSNEDIADARDLTDAGISKSEVARRPNVSRHTLYTALNGSGTYAKRKMLGFKPDAGEVIDVFSGSGQSSKCSIP